MKSTFGACLRSRAVRMLVVVGVSMFAAASLYCDDAAAAGADDYPGLAVKLATAKRLEVEDVCSPVAVSRRGRMMWVLNPDGKTYDILQWYWRNYQGPTEVHIIDTATGKTNVGRIPDGRQIHMCGRALAPNGKFYLTTTGGPKGGTKGMEIHVYDPAANKLTSLGVQVPGLLGGRRPLATGLDGMIYGASGYNITGTGDKRGKAGCYKIDPDTNKVTIYGAVGPKHTTGAAWGYSCGADERYVYVASGKVPWYLVAYDRETKKDRVLLTHNVPGGHLGVRQKRYGCEVVLTAPNQKWQDFKWYWLYQGKVIPKKDAKEKPPWPQPEVEKPKPPKPEMWPGRATPDVKGNIEIWYRTAEAKAKAAAAPAEDKTVDAKAPPAELVEANAEEQGWQVYRARVLVYPMKLHRITELEDGRIFGTAGYYHGNFIYDPKTDKSVHMGKIMLSHYSTSVVGDKIYMSGYPGSPVYVYDPSEEWTANTSELFRKPMSENSLGSNPRRVAILKKGAGTHVMYASEVGADGKVYFGGRWMRDGAGGGLGWWDPDAGEAGGLWKPLSNAQITHMTTANDGKSIILSTLAVDDKLLKKPRLEQGRLFVFDTEKGEIVSHMDPVPKVSGTGPVVGVGGGRVMGLTHDPDVADGKGTILYCVDVNAGKVLFAKRLAMPLRVRLGGNQKEPWDFRLGPDGMVWTFLKYALVTINPADGAIKVLGKVHGNGHLAFSGRDVYLSGGVNLRRIKGINRSARSRRYRLEGGITAH